MRRTQVILDTGPLVAFFNKSDRYHEWALSKFSELYPPFYTCEAVLSEACFLLRNYHNAETGIFELLKRELIIVTFDLQSAYSDVNDLMKKYRDVPMSFADACIVRMAEQSADSRVCTLDSEFRIYRMQKRRVIPVIMPVALR